MHRPISLRWCPTSEEELEKAESDLLSTLKLPIKTSFVDIGPGWGSEKNNIRTLEMPNSQISGTDDRHDADKNLTKTQNSKQMQPLVLVHGFAAGIGTWILNLDALSTTLNRKIYAFDVIGFGRSVRAPFNLTEDVEGQFVNSIERWRAKVGLEKFILLGHSLGGYLSASYALKHPQRVSHVILADPWGIQEQKAVDPNRISRRFPFWVRAVSRLFQYFTPLALLRAIGPYGPSLVHTLRPDLKEKFRPKLNDECDKFLNYIYHCNAQTATGEAAFKALTLPYGWARNPLLHRLLELDESVNLTFIYGARSWIEKEPGEFLRDCMQPGRVTVNVIQGSGHHVYADKFEEFNEYVQEACSKVDA